MTITLDLLKHSQKLLRKKEDGKLKFFDPIRKKYIVATPEESVRQLLTLYFLEELNFPKASVSIEKTLIVNKLQKRFDIVIFDHNTLPYILVECKSPKISLNDDTFRQAANYNLELKAPYLVITNGVETYCCNINFEEKNFNFTDKIPDYHLMLEKHI